MLERQCNFAGEVIPKLSKIYDGVESLDYVSKVDELKCDYSDVESHVSKHHMLVRFSEIPKNYGIEEITDVASKLVSEQNASLENSIVRIQIDDDSIMFELHIKWL